MGYFGSFLYYDDQWHDDANDPEEPWLRIEIHDSDIATVEYSPNSGVPGRFYLGWEPRDYFDNPDAHDPIDREAEAVAFSRWAQSALGSAVTGEEILPLMANPEGEPDEDFVEETVADLLDLLDLELPEDLPIDFED